MLIDLFVSIAKKTEEYTSEQIHNYARSMIGIDLSSNIEKWICENDITHCFFSEDQLIDMILSFFKDTHVINKAAEELDSVCKLWIAGKTLFEINQDLSIPISDVEDVCSKTISYELSFFVGNIIDMLRIDDEDENTIDPDSILCSLQKKIKYGVPSETAVSICEKVFSDRYLANILSVIIGNNDVGPEDIIETVEHNRDRIFRVLSDYPDYFTERLQFLLK